MAGSLLNLVNNLSKGIHRIHCKYGYDDKKCETCGIKNKYCSCFLQYTNFLELFSTMQMFNLQEKLST